MSLSPPEDSDPLLEFTTEPGGSAPKPADALLTRVESLERALEESKSQVASMKSELATLVRTVSDIRKQPSRPIAPTPAASRSRTHRAPAIVGLIIGATLGAFAWMFLAGDDDVAIASPPAAASTPPTDLGTDIGGLAPNVVQTNSVVKTDRESTVDNKRDDRGLAPTVARENSIDTRDRRGQPPNVTSVKYVGTLTIDAEPAGDVLINREPAGRTPLRLTNLRAGSHLVWVEREGYRRWTRVVHVPADRVTRLSAELEPIAAR